MKWLEEYKELISSEEMEDFLDAIPEIASEAIAKKFIYLMKHTSDRLIAIAEEAEWGSILCDDIPDPMCPICSGSEESGHGLVYETKRPCPYSDEWVKS